MSLLKQVQKGRKLKPLALILHAPHGIGKSTFATEAPNPIYIGDEENDELDVDRFPKIREWHEFEDQLKTLLEDDHDYKTVVIDTMDGMQQLAERLILSNPKEKAKSLNQACGGYGNGPAMMANMFIGIRDKYLKPLREKKGMNIVILCHSAKVKHEEAMTLTSYDHYETALHKKVKPVFEDWVSAILFANYYLVRAETTSGKEYAESADGMRMIYTEERPSHVAKNRFNFPYEIEFNKSGTWEVIKKMVISYFKVKKKEAKDEGKELDSGLEELKSAIAEILPKMPDEVGQSVKASIERAKDDKKELKRIFTKMQKAIS